MSVGWQDELLVNDCLLCQKADFFFPDVCVSATAFPSSVPLKYCSLFTSSRSVSVTHFCLLHLSIIFICMIYLLCLKCRSRAFPCRQTTAQIAIKSFGRPRAYVLMNHGSLEVIPLCPTYKSTENYVRQQYRAVSASLTLSQTEELSVCE